MLFMESSENESINEPGFEEMIIKRATELLEK